MKKVRETAAAMVVAGDGALMTVNPELTAFIEKSLAGNKLEKAKLDGIKACFGPFWDLSDQWQKDADEIEVADESDKKSMMLAGKLRKEIKRVRVEIENRRKEIKAEVVAEGKLIDMIGNLFKTKLGSIEESLAEKEEYDKRLEADRRDIRRNVRSEILSKFQFAPLPGVNLGAISDEDFEQIRITAEQSFAFRQQTARENAEREKRESEKLARRSERIKTLSTIGFIFDPQREAFTHACQLAITEKSIDALFDDVFDLQVDSYRTIIDAWKDQQASESEALNREIAERRQKDEEAIQAKADAALQSDRQKLINFADELDCVDVPKMTDPDLVEIEQDVRRKLFDISEWVRTCVQNRNDFDTRQQEFADRAIGDEEAAKHEAQTLDLASKAPQVLADIDGPLFDLDDPKNTHMLPKNHPDWTPF